MKTRILLTFLLFLAVFKVHCSNATGKTETESEKIRICTTSEIQNLAKSWISEYNKTNTDLKFEFSLLNSAEIGESIAESSNTLGFVIQRPDISFANQSIWRMSVGRDVIVAVISSENPFLETLYKNGVSENELENLFTNKKQKEWRSLVGKNSIESVKTLILDDPEIQFSVLKFLGNNPSVLETMEKKSADEFLKTMKKEKYAIGFCRLATITDAEKNDFISGIKLLPIDRNKNGHLDYNENIYADLNQFERSVWIGKYPKPLICNIYAIANELPKNEGINDFLNWIIVSGQSVVEQSGYTNLVYNEVQSNLEKLNPPVLIAGTQQKENNQLSTILLVALVFVAGIIVLSLVLRSRKKKTKAPLGSFSRGVKILNEDILSFPRGLYFDKSHTWVFMEEKGLVKVGIDDFLPNVTGDFTRVVLKNPGENVKRREPIATLIQKGKQITISAPVSGTIKEINEALVVDPFMINSSPYSDGWVYKIEPSNWFREMEFFKLGNEYKEWIKSEIVRLKDFLACSFNIKSLTNEKLAFQEGGELIPEPLKNLEPKIWEDFQNYFIESADKY